MCALLGLPHPGWRMIKSTVSKHKETKSSKAAPCVLNKLKQVILHIIIMQWIYQEVFILTQTWASLEDHSSAFKTKPKPN